MVQSDRVPHAQLFLGPPGCGKLALAIAFAQYLLCQQISETAACGQCPTCHKVAKFIHPDLHFSFPVVGTKMTSNHYLTQWREAIGQNPYLEINQWLQYIGAENKQGNINVDECNSIIKKLSLKTFEATHKVLIMWLPEYLGKEGNRLLKLIEEPPAQTFFLLVAENSERILPTILSRCQLVKVNPLTDEAVREALDRQFPDKPVDRLAWATHLAGGNLNEALQLLQQGEQNVENRFLDWLRKCYRGNGAELVTWVEAFAKIGRENQKQLIQYALHFLRELLQLTLVPNAQVRLQKQELTTAQNLTKVLDFEQIEQIATLLNDCHYHIGRNANPKILFLDASIQINKIIKAKKAVA